jgi:hypothetical protein
VNVVQLPLDLVEASEDQRNPVVESHHPHRREKALAATARAVWEPVWEKWQEVLSSPEMLGRTSLK